MTSKELDRWQDRMERQWDDGYYRLRRGTAEDMAKRRPIWAAMIDQGKLRIFIRCFQCAAIERIDGHQIYGSGYVGHCIHCTKCHHYFYATIDDWPGSKAELETELKLEIEKQTGRKGKAPCRKPRSRPGTCSSTAVRKRSTRS